MSKSTSVYQPKGYTTALAKLANADGTASKLLLTAGADDSIVKSLLLTSTDTSPRNVELIVKTGGTEYVLATIAVPAGSGTDGTNPSVDALDITGLPIDSASKKILPLKAAYELRIRAQSTVTSAKEIVAVATAEDF